MEPSEPTQPGTSLEIASEPDPETVAGPPGTSLELPQDGPATGELDTVRGSPEPDEPGMLGNLVVARFRRAEAATLGRVLITTLSDALPSSMIRVERRRSVGQRLARRTPEPIGITIAAGDRTLSLRAPDGGVVEATIGHTVRGVVLSSAPVPVAQWLDALGEVLEQLSRDDDATRIALERTLLS